MSEDKGELLRRAAQEQQRMAAMSPEDRALEQLRRSQLGGVQNSSGQRPVLKQPGQSVRKPQSKMKKRLIWGGVIVVVLGAWVVFANLVDSTSTSATLLDSGDCFEFPATGESAERLETPDCIEPHNAQFYYRFKPAGLSSEQKSAKCLDEGSINILNDKLEGTAELGFFEIGREDRSSYRVLCYIKHPQNVTESHVEFGPKES